MFKAAFVIHRFGADFAGGSESLALGLANKLKDDWDITVFTTCAKDYLTWANHYTPGYSNSDGIKMIRYPVKEERNIANFSETYNQLVSSSSPGKLNKKQEDWFFEAQGPQVPELVDDLERRYKEFDAFIFFTYLYYTSVQGIPRVCGKAYLVSTAHDEYPFYLKKTLGPIFLGLEGLIYLSPSEKRLVESTYRLSNKAKKIRGGFGIDGKEMRRLSVLPMKKYQRFENEPYFLFLGRACASKGCNLLVSAFQEFRIRYHSQVKLLFIGSLEMDISDLGSSAKYIGFVDEQEKAFFLKHALATINPSTAESLSIVMFESWSVGTPVIINGNCDVTREFCREADAGIYFYTIEMLIQTLIWFENNKKESANLGQNGWDYVKQYCCWDTIKANLINGIEK